LYDEIAVGLGRGSVPLG